MRKRVVSLLLAVVMIATLFAGVTAQEVTKVYIDTSDISMKAGEVSTLPVVIENNPGFDSADILIQFDTKAIELVAVLDSYGGQDGLMEAGTILGNIDNRTVNFMSIEVIEGDGILFWIQCRPKTPIINTDTPILILPTEDVDSPFTNTTLPGTGVVECVSDSKNVAITGGLDVSEVTPVVTVSGKTDYGYGETATALTANASVANVEYGSTVTYQWYQMDGEEGTEISDATASTYTPALTAFGSEQYYCVVTNTLDNGRTFSAASDFVTVTYSKKSLEGMALTLNPSSTGYTGEEQTVAASVDGVNSEEYTVSGNTAGTNVGSYTVTATAVVDGNYTGSTSATWKITPATLSGNGNTAMTVYTNGQMYKVPFAADSVDDATVTYSYKVTKGSNLIEVDENGNVTAKGTDTGSAEIEVTATCPNHNELKQTISVTVANKEDVSSSITFTSKNVSQVYTGSDIAASTLLNAATVTAESGLDSANLYYTYNGQKYTNLNEIKFLNAGSYTVTAVYEDDTHYGEVAVTVTIDKATIDVSGYSWDYTSDYSYDGTEKAVALTGVDAEKVQVTYGGTTTAKNAGSYSATASLAPVDSTNYQLTGGKTKSLDWAISPKSVELSITGGETVSYGTAYSHAASYDVVAGDAVNATITYLDADSQIIAKPANAGSYQVKATINDANYSAAPATQRFTITKADYEGTAAKTVSIVKNRTEAQTGTLTAAAFLTETLDGATITGISTGTTNVLSKVPTVAGGVLSYTSQANLTGTISDDVYTVTISTTNYNDINATLTFHATDKIDVSDQITFSDGLSTYNAEVQTYENATCALTAGTITYTYEPAEVKNAGTYTVTATYEDDDHIGTASAKFTIQPKPLTVTVGTAAITKVYDGTIAAGTPTGDVVIEGIYEADAGKEPYVTLYNIPDYTDANVHTETLEVQVARENVLLPNYSLTLASQKLLVPATITPKAITPTVEDIDAVTYNGKAQTPAVTVLDDDTALTTNDYTVRYENNVNAGTATAIISAKAGGNYTFDQVTKNFTINKANYTGSASYNVNVLTNQETPASGTISVDSFFQTVPAGATITAVRARTISYDIMDSVVASDGAITYRSNTNLKTADLRDTYNVTISTKNYNDITATLTFTTVDKTPVIVSGVAVAGKTYDGKTVSYTGTPVAKVDGSTVAVTGFTYTWMKDGVALTHAPKDAGSYKLRVAVAETDPAYTGYVDLSFTISKATITITAQNASVTVNSSMPKLSYQVSGLAAGEKLATEPTLTCNAKLNQIGSYAIVPSGAAVPNTDNYNETIVYKNGTLSVVSNEKPQVTVTGGTHGFATISDPDAEEGDVVTITVTCDPGYEVDEVIVTTLSGKSVRVVKTGGKYTFVMPAEKVKIQVTYQEIQEVAYTDVVVGSWYEEAVAYVSDNGIMNGVGGGKFAPNRAVTRAMVWTVLARMDGEDTASTGLWYAKAQQWAMETGVSDGTNPESAITREQLATMLYRYYGSPAISGSLSGYADGASVTDWAKDAMVWAVQEGLIQGTGGNKLSPTADTTRAQLAQILMRLDLKF